MAENQKISLADIRRKEEYDGLLQVSDRDLCEMIRTHFETHPALPGEETLKDRANRLLDQLDTMSSNNSKTNEKQTAIDDDLAADGFGPAANTPFDNGNLLAPGEKKDLAMKYAQTRIRETSLKDGDHYLDFRFFGVDTLKRETIDRVYDKTNETACSEETPYEHAIHTDKVNAELQKTPSGNVCVMAEKPDGSFRMVGSLEDDFLKNNPMNVNSCPAELEITDFLFCGWKSMSAKVIVNTDIMSGDIIMLDDDLLAGLEQGDAPAQ